MSKKVYLLLLGLLGWGMSMDRSYAAGPEVYPAMEEETLVSLEEPTPPAPIPTADEPAEVKTARATRTAIKKVPKPKAKKLTLRQRIEVLEKEVTVLRSDKPQKSEPQDRFSFDPVPANHAPQIAERLKLVELLILRYGRAYDYRQMTLPELKAVFTKLEREEHSSL